MANHNLLYMPLLPLALRKQHILTRLNRLTINYGQTNKLRRNSNPINQGEMETQRFARRHA